MPDLALILLRPTFVCSVAALVSWIIVSVGIEMLCEGLEPRISLYT